MAKITNGLFSLAASGDLASTLTFVCGSFARGKNLSADEKEVKNPEREALFKIGANKWSQVLSNEMRENWKNFRNSFIGDSWCTYDEFNITGYNLWMLYWLKFGENGWLHYPNPPVS